MAASTCSHSLYLAAVRQSRGRIDRIRRSGSHGCANEAGKQAGFDVGRDLLFKRIGTHGKIAINRNLSQVVGTHAAIFIAFSTEE